VILTSFALDYDNTIAFDGVLHPGVRAAIGEVREMGLAVVLATGRQIADLTRCAGDLACFDAVVAENGAVLEFPASGRHVRLGRPPKPLFLEELGRRGIPFTTGECVVEAEAAAAKEVIDAVRATEEPLAVAFNRGRLMVLPQGTCKSAGLRQALYSLRLSLHNAAAIGDAENDSDLLESCELGVAVAWGSLALQASADHVIAGSGGERVADYMRSLAAAPHLAARGLRRRRIALGNEMSGAPLSIAVRGRTILIAGEPGSGKSWLAGLLCEQLILQGYCLFVIDPEGDYRTLETLPGVATLGGADPPPGPRELERALRHPYVSIVLDLSRLTLSAKQGYVESLLPLLEATRRRTGLPHKFVLDEAHYFLGEPDAMRSLEPGLDGYVLVTYRVSTTALPAQIAADALVLVTRESDPAESATLAGMCRGTPTPPEFFGQLGLNEAALLPGPEEAQGRAIRFRLGPRLTHHVRHRAKYLDMQVAPEKAFRFGGGQAQVARSLGAFVGLVSGIAGGTLATHAHRRDFSRWVREVYRDEPLASELARLEEEAPSLAGDRLATTLCEAIRSRYIVQSTA
jgi:hydroxymethylpyrimidine pyrophosphatase-like HAD family hydrolase